MAVISAALILAAIKSDPTVYKQPVDIFRAVCEGLTLLLITFSLLSDILLIIV